MGWTRRARGDLLALAGFAVAALAFYWPVLFGGQVLLPLDDLWTMPPWVGPPGAVPHNQLIGDMILQNYPWKLILDQALRQRELPLWNPYVMGGLPYLATGQTGVLYPFVLLFVLLGPLRAYGWFCALHQFIAASLTYLLLRRLGIGRLAASVGGLVFAFSFFLTVSYIWPMVLGAAVWLPLALWSLAGLAQAATKRRLGRAFALDFPAGALAIALSVLGGHLEITFYAAFAVALYALYLAIRLWRRDQIAVVGRFLLASVLVVGLGVLVAGVQLAPFLEILQTNNRQGDTTYQQVISYALPRRQVLGLLMPDYFGNPTAHSYFDLTTLRSEAVGANALGQATDPPNTIKWGTPKNYVEAGGYVGVVPVVLAILGALLSSHRDRWYFLGLAAISLLLAFGSPLYALIYYGLPFFSQLRTPFRWLYPFDFAMAGLAALGTEAVVRIQNPESRRQKAGWARSHFWILDSGFWILLRWLPAALGVAGLAVLAGTFILRGRSVAVADRILRGSPELQRAFASGAMLYSYEFRNLAIFLGLLAVGGVVIGAMMRFPLTPSPLPPAGGRGPWSKPEANSLVHVAQERLGRRSEHAASVLASPPRGGEGGGGEGAPPWLRSLLAALLLTTVVGDLFFLGTRFATKASGAILDQRIDLNQAIPANLAGPRAASLGDPTVLQPNLNVLFGLPSVAGYDTIIASDYRRLWSKVEPPVDLPYNKIGIVHQTSSLASPILDLLGVRYVLSEGEIASPAVRLATQLGPIRIYERPTALPRAFVVEAARWVPDRDAALQVVAEANFRPGQMVVLEGTDPHPNPLPRAGEGTGPAGTATIVDYRFDQVTVDARVERAGWLVLADANAPGWEATVDGAAAPVLTADAFARAVYLTPGSHRVVFRYSPLSLRVGAYVSFLALVVLALATSWSLWRRLIGHYAGQAERVLRNATLPMAASLLNKVIDFGFAALMLRVLGPFGVGEYTSAIVYSGYFDLLTGFGLNALITREVARDRAAAGRYLANAVAVRLVLCMLATPVVVALALFGPRWLGLDDRTVVAFVLLAVALVPGNLTSALSALFNAWERNEVPAVVAVGTNLARVALGVVALLAGAGIVGLAAIALLLNVALLVAFAVIARRELRIRLTTPVLAELPGMLAESYPLLLNLVLVTIFFKVDVLLLQAIKGSEAVGYYATAYKWVDGLLIIPSTFTFAVYPALSRFARDQGEGLRATYDVSVRVLLALAVPIAIGIAFLAGDLILLLGGDAYYPQSAQALQILIWFLPFSYLNGLTQYALIAVHRQRFITLAFVVAAGFNLLANLLFIPRYGFYAASAITVLSEIVLMVPFLYAARRSVGWPSWWRAAGKPTLAGVVMALLAYVGRPVEPHLALLVGALAYAVAVWTLGVFSPEEIGVLRELVTRTRRRAKGTALEV